MVVQQAPPSQASSLPRCHLPPSTRMTLPWSSAPGPGLSQESARRYGELTKLKAAARGEGASCPGRQAHGAPTLPSLSSAPPDVPEPL